MSLYSSSFFFLPFISQSLYSSSFIFFFPSSFNLSTPFLFFYSSLHLSISLYSSSFLLFFPSSLNLSTPLLFFYSSHHLSISQIPFFYLKFSCKTCFQVWIFFVCVKPSKKCNRTRIVTFNENLPALIQIDKKREIKQISFYIMNHLTDLPKILTGELSWTTGMFWAWVLNSKMRKLTFAEKVKVQDKAGFPRYSLYVINTVANPILINLNTPR